MIFYLKSEHNDIKRSFDRPKVSLGVPQGSFKDYIQFCIVDTEGSKLIKPTVQCY